MKNSLSKLNMKWSSYYLNLLLAIILVFISQSLTACTENNQLSEEKGGGTEVVAIHVQDDGILFKNKGSSLLEDSIVRIHVEFSINYLSDSNAIYSEFTRLNKGSQSLKIYHKDIQGFLTLDSTSIPLNINFNDSLVHTLDVYHMGDSLYLLGDDRLIETLSIEPNGEVQEILLLNDMDAYLYEFRYEVFKEDSWEILVDINSQKHLFVPNSNGLVELELNDYLFEGQLTQVVLTNYNLLHTDLDTIDFQIISTYDDAEEDLSGVVQLKSSDLDFMSDLNQSNEMALVGLRFTNIARETLIGLKKAILIFNADDDATYDTRLQVGIQTNSNCKQFDSNPFNLSERILNRNLLLWSPPIWDKSEYSYDTQLHGVEMLIKGFNDFNQWNDLCFLIKGYGNRDAVSFDNDPSRAPILRLISSQ